MRRPYSIRLFNFDTTSGGIKVMYGLYGALLGKGEEIVANAIYNQEIDSVGIYPEISHGNELQTKHVVRYILNKPGVMSSNGIPGPTAFEKTDILFTFSKMFMDLPDDRCLFLPVINMEVFKDLGKKRTKSAVFQGKGINTNQHNPNAVIINRELARNQEKLAETLNECEVLYSYDPVSAMTEVARLCGCRVVYLSNTYTREDYLKYEPGTNGITFPDDKDVSPLNSKAFREHYSDLYAQFWSIYLPNFIKTTQQ